MAQDKVAKKATTRTVMPGTTFPLIKSIFIKSAPEQATESELIAELVFHEAPSMHQEKTLKDMLMNHKTTHAGFYVAMQVDGRSLRFRRLGNKRPPTSQGLREMLNSMGIGEVSIIQPPSPRSAKKSPVLPRTGQKTGLSAHHAI